MTIVRTWLGHELFCPECWTPNPVREDVDPGGVFVVVRCTRCDLHWRVTG